MQKTKFQYVLIGILLSTILLSSCKKSVVQSSWNNGQIHIDGLYSDWQSNIMFNEKDNVGFGVANDSSRLYICLVASDRQLMRQVMNRGLECNIDVPGSKRRIFGIKYPTGIENVASAQMSRGQRGRMKPESGEDTNIRLEDLQTEFILLGPEKEEQQIIPLQNDYGIGIKTGRSYRQFVYEIQIPFRLINEYLIVDESKLKSELTVVFKTAEIDLSEMRSGAGRTGGRAGGHPGGMSGGGTGGQRGGGRTGSPGMQRPTLEKFEFRTKVLLASPE
ncbi:MAG TPA: hypothetical protein DHW42_10755 [Candidatus Marinimicrobia bacterium]|nr:hypothetical protein [Candidatus Neomarinimicrobiota bacterium]